MLHILLASVFFLAASVPTAVQLDADRFRVSMVFDDTGPMGHANAQIALINAARQHCKGKGQATSEGALELSSAEPLRKGRKALGLAEVYRCAPTD